MTVRSLFSITMAGEAVLPFPLGAFWSAPSPSLVLSPAFPATALVVDQAPEPSGLVRSRILCDGRPHDEADVVASNLEDGYLWLVREGNG